MGKRTDKPAFDAIAGRLAELNTSELHELQRMIETLIAAQDGDNEEQAETSREKRTAAGHIESKTINGCGPYLYLRYWQGGTLKSKYIGKAKA